MKKYDLYIFDYDGTLVNSFKSLYNIFDISYREIGIQIKPGDEVMLSRISLVDGYKLMGGKLEENMMNKFANAIIREVDSPNSLIGTTIYPETINVLKTLKNNGAILAISTSNKKEHVIEGLKALNVDPNLFDVIIGNMECEKHKPDPEPVLNVLKALNYKGDKKDVIYIGDAINDTICGKRAEVDYVLVERMNEYPEYKEPKINTLEELIK
ncbi:MAG: HAD family hydrolase [Bacilli bacterium]|nr:HAD family hydrolase [Bacilli bacterium]